MIDAKDKRIVALIINKIDRLIEICSKYSLEEIEENFMISDSLQYEFEKMYEDSTRLSKQLQKDFEDTIDKLRGTRNRVAHDYTSVIISILVDTVKNDLPQLKEQLESLL